MKVAVPKHLAEKHMMYSWQLTLWNPPQLWIAHVRNLLSIPYWGHQTGWKSCYIGEIHSSTNKSHTWQQSPLFTHTHTYYFSFKQSKISSSPQMRDVFTEKAWFKNVQPQCWTHPSSSLPMFQWEFTAPDLYCNLLISPPIPPILVQTDWSFADCFPCNCTSMSWKIACRSVTLWLTAVSKLSLLAACSVEMCSRLCDGRDC